MFQNIYQTSVRVVLYIKRVFRFWLLENVHFKPRDGRLIHQFINTISVCGFDHVMTECSVHSGLSPRTGGVVAQRLCSLLGRVHRFPFSGVVSWDILQGIDGWIVWDVVCGCNLGYTYAGVRCELIQHSIVFVV